MNHNRPFFCLLAFIAASFAASFAAADIKLPKIFSDHMVIQQQQKTSVWGLADKGEKVTVTFGETSADCLVQTSPAAETLCNPEPGLFILGSKSYGRDSRFLLKIGFEQIRNVLSMLEQGSGG